MDANEALRQLGEATREVNREARQHLERGAHPDAVALGLLRISDGLPEDVTVAQLGAQTDKLSDTSRATVAERAVDGLTGEHRAAVAERAVDGLTDEHKAAVARRAVDGLADEHKAAVAKQATGAMSDEEFARFVAEEMKRRRAGGPPTTN